MSKTLLSLADGADVMSTSVGYEQPAANVADFYGIPFVAMHTMPWRPNGQRRRELRLPKATGPSARRIAERGSLEIQAYDDICFPGLAAE